MSIDTSVMPLQPHYIRPNIIRPNKPGLVLWWRQYPVVLGQALRASLLSKRLIISFILILIPMTFIATVGLIPTDDGQPITDNLSRARTIFGYVYSTFFLGAVLFLGNALTFTSLIRGDILNRSIHYSLLCPVRREILVLGKFSGGLIASAILFCSATVICYLLIYIPYGTTRLSMDLSGGIAMEQIMTYTLMTLMGCIGYGGLFMVAGLLFRNPLFPVLVIAGWEAISFLLPSTLKLFSVVYYLKSLMPVLIDEGPLPLAVISSPLSPGVAIAGVIGLSALCIVISVLHMRKMEVRYTDD